MRKVLKLFSLMRNTIYVRALLNGAAAAIEHEKLLNKLNCKYIVDIGANKGQFALVARKCMPEAKIVSFEPLEKPAKIFESVFEKDRRVALHQIAVGASNEETIIHVSQSEDSSSLLPITDNQSKLFPGTEEKETRKVIVKKLSDVISMAEIIEPAILKIDVQGYEMSALIGAQDMLTKFQYIYVECSFVELYLNQSLAHEIIEFLVKYGFILMGIYNVSLDNEGIAIQADFLFLKK